MENPYKDDAKDMESARSMDKIAKTVFAPIYPLLAGQIKVTHGITSGICIDVGSGPGALSIALAKITDLDIYSLDQSKHAKKIAEENVKAQGLSRQIRPVRNDVTDMPFEDNFADLIISRGSIFFWEDKVAAFNEIFRVLKPGGRTHIGGGFGSRELKNAIFEEMAKKDEGFSKNVKSRMGPENKEIIKKALAESDVHHFDINKSDSGFWIHIVKKESARWQAK